MTRLLINLAASLTLIASIAKAETLTLITSDANEEPHYSQKVTLAEGDVAEFIYNSNPSVSMELTIGEHVFDYIGLQFDNPTSIPKIAGPAEFRVYLQPYHRPQNSYAALSTFKITRAASAANAMVPSTAVVIPNDAEGQFEVILESSIDMVTWTPAMPGTYAGNNPNRFFRTRIVKKP